MGCALDYIVVNNVKNIQGVAQDFAQRNVDRQVNPFGKYHGNLKILTDLEPFACSEDAFDWIHNHRVYGERYRDVAVPFYDTSGVKPSKAVRDLEERYEKNRKAWKDYELKNVIKNRESASITCPQCGSRIMLAAMDDTQRCPLPRCKSDLRSTTVQERLAKYKRDDSELAKKIRNQTAQSVSKATNKAKVAWLLKVSVHC